MGFERIDRRGENAAKAAQKELLDEIESEIGHEAYERIIGALVNGNVENLSPEEKAVLARLRKQYTPTKH